MKIPQDIWHPVLLSRELAKKPLKQLRFGLTFVFWRDAENKPHAFPDRCPHLGASLSQGVIRAGKLVCPFHGFEYSIRNLKFENCPKPIFPANIARAIQMTVSRLD